MVGARTCGCGSSSGAACVVTYTVDGARGGSHHAGSQSLQIGGLHVVLVRQSAHLRTGAHAAGAVVGDVGSVGSVAGRMR